MCERARAGDERGCGREARSVCSGLPAIDGADCPPHARRIFISARRGFSSPCAEDFPPHPWWISRHGRSRKTEILGADFHPHAWREAGGEGQKLFRAAWTRSWDCSMPSMSIEPISGGETRLPVTAIRIGIMKSPSFTPSFSARCLASASACS